MFMSLFVNAIRIIISSLLLVLILLFPTHFLCINTGRHPPPLYFIGPTGLLYWFLIRKKPIPIAVYSSKQLYNRFLLTVPFTTTESQLYKEILSLADPMISSLALIGGPTGLRYYLTRDKWVVDYAIGYTIWWFVILFECTLCVRFFF